MTRPETERPVADFRCGILDVLEAAALHGEQVDVRLDGRWCRVRVLDVASEGGEDWLVGDGGERIAVQLIEMACPAAG